MKRCWNCMEKTGDTAVCPRCGFNHSVHRASPQALPPGTVLRDKYLIGNVLGQGGFGITYIGFDLVLEMKVAIKEYFPLGNAGRSPGDVTVSFLREDNSSQGHSQFLSEAKKMAKINMIPEIVSVRDTFEENNTAYIVMDYIPGKTMKDYVKSHGRLSYKDCVELMLPLIYGLDKVHRQGMIHRDISPDNLMLTSEGKLYLLDLGAAKDLKDKSSAHVSASKKGFSPIEQNSTTGKIGPCTDVYSLAASIYYCIYGKTVPPSLERLERDTLTFDKNIPTPLTAKQVAVLKKGLAVQPKMRYVSTMEFYMALKDSITNSMPDKTKKILIGISAFLAICILFFLTPSTPTVEFIPTFVTTDYLRLDGLYEYYTDQNGSLNRIAYDSEDGTFHSGDAEIIFQENGGIENDGVRCITEADGFLYYIYYGGVGKSDYVYTMNYDGTDKKAILEMDKIHTPPIYVKLSNGKEYFYYLEDETKSLEDEDGSYSFHLYRYDIDKEQSEKLSDIKMEWYALFDKYLYYSCFDEINEVYVLYRSDFDGKDAELIDATHSYFGGGVINDRLYLFQQYNSSGEGYLGLLECDVNGQPVDEEKGVFFIDFFVDYYTVGDGWMYYNESGTDELYRIMLDGTNKEKIAEGYCYEWLCYNNNMLYFLDGAYNSDGTYEVEQICLMQCDGTQAPVTRGSKIVTDEQGCQFSIVDNEVKFIGYLGTETDVIFPLRYEGNPISFDGWDDFYFAETEKSKVNFYALIPDDELEYLSYGDGIIITGYTPSETASAENVAIPTEINGKTVLKIGDKAFAGSNFKAVYLPKELEEIGENSFKECSNLKKVIFPDSLLKINNYAFYQCSFKGADIVIPDSVQSLGMLFLGECDPDSVKLPMDLDTVGSGFLSKCSGEIIVDSDHPRLSVVDGILFSKKGTVLYAYPSDRTGSYKVPDTVTKIFDGAFMYSQLSKVTLPMEVTEIERLAFAYSEITTVKLNKDAEIDDSAFKSTNNVSCEYY